MDERDQSLEGTLVALRPLEEQSGDLRVVIANVVILGLSSLRAEVFSTRGRRGAAMLAGSAEKPWCFWLPRYNTGAA
jgi:hypothetical protein